MTAKLSTIADRICAAVMLGLCALVLLHQILGQGWAGEAAKGAALLLTLAVIPRFGLREWALLGLALALAGSLTLREGGLADLGLAVGKAAYFSAFILLMMLLREAAVTSASVLEVGRWITGQPPGRRFVTTWFGGHLAGILMNFGAISLLAPLIQRGVRADAEPTEEGRLRADRLERRQLSALVRGFAWVICWAPTTLTQVIILESVPGLDPGLAIAMGLGLSALMLSVAWVEDRARWGLPARQGVRPPFPRRAGLDLAIVYALLIGGALAVQATIGGPLTVALMAVAPVMLVGWVTLQGRAGTLAHSSGARLGEIALFSVPKMAQNAYLLGVAGFIGICAARLAPVDAIAVWIEGAGLPGWTIVAALPVVITLGGQVALSPMVMVVFLAAVVASLPELPAAPEFIAIALGAGWALSMTASPNASGALLLAGATGIASTTLTWRWNGVYSLMVLAVLTVMIWLVVG